MLARAAAVDDTDANLVHSVAVLRGPGLGSPLSPYRRGRAPSLIVNVTAAGFGFSVRATDGQARVGRVETPHGSFDTPAFMPVGTQGSVKTLLQRDLEGLGAGIILGNTYHLMLRPGDPLIARLGGLHRFIGWNRPIL